MLSGLALKSPKVIIIHAIPHVEDRSQWQEEWLGWDDFLEQGRKLQLGRSANGEVEWNRLQFDAPLWILFSSGTTGRPKSVTQSWYLASQLTHHTDPSYIELVECSSNPRKNLRFVATFVLMTYFSITQRRLYQLCIQPLLLSTYLQY